MKAHILKAVKTVIAIDPGAVGEVKVLILRLDSHSISTALPVTQCFNCLTPQNILQEVVKTSK